MTPYYADDENTYVRPGDGARLCRECTRANDRSKARNRRAKARAAA